MFCMSQSLFLGTGTEGIPRVTGLPIRVVTFHWVMKTFVSFLPGYQNFLPQKYWVLKLAAILELTEKQKQKKSQEALHGIIF